MADLKLHANNASSTLNGSITNVQTTITLTDASSFPVPTGSQFAAATINDGTNREIIHYTGVSSNDLTGVTRAQEGSSNFAFADGVSVQQLITADDIDRKMPYTVQPGTSINFGAADDFELPNGSSPTLDTDGQTAVDTSVTDFSHGILKYYSGEELGVISMPIAQFTSPSNYDHIEYDATNDEFVLRGPTFIGFSASRTTAQSIATSSATKIQLSTENFDSEGDFDNATNYRHTPSIAGKWLYIGVTSGTFSDQVVATSDIYKNGTSAGATLLYMSSSSSGQLIIQNSVLLDMNGSTDYVELYMFHTEGSNVNTLTGGSSPKLVGIYLGDI